MKDMGDYWFDDEAEPKIEYYENGYMKTYIYCPYIPKIFATEGEKLEMDAICTPPISIIKKFLDSQKE